MKKTKIYLVLACTDYEHDDPVLAFDNKADAEKFVAKCNEYHNKRPEGPATIEDTPENDALYATYSAKIDLWEKRHPAGAVHAYCTRFQAWPVPMVSNAMLSGGCKPSA